MASRDPKQDLLPHVTFPIPDLKTTPKPGTLSREERLKTIIDNLDQHHQVTRANIIEAGKQNLAQALQDTNRNRPTNEDADSDMDIDPSPPHAPPADPAGMTLMFANLNTPYHESMGDPFSTGPVPPPDTTIKQSTPPPEIYHAKETLDKLALYDSIALPARQFYSDALDRLNGPTPSVDPRRTSSGSGSAFAKPSPREAGSNLKPGSSSRAASGTFGASADPRLAGRSGNGSWAKQSPMQSPVERTTDPRLRR